MLFARCPSIKRVYGLGTFFASTEFGDIDLFVEIECCRSDLLEISREVEILARKITSSVGINLDVTFLTPEECVQASSLGFDLSNTFYERYVGDFDMHSGKTR